MGCQSQAGDPTQSSRCPQSSPSSQRDEGPMPEPQHPRFRSFNQRASHVKCHLGKAARRSAGHTRNGMPPSESSRGPPAPSRRWPRATERPQLPSSHGVSSKRAASQPGHLFSVGDTAVTTDTAPHLGRFRQAAWGPGEMCSPYTYVYFCTSKTCTNFWAEAVPSQRLRSWLPPL